MWGGGTKDPNRQSVHQVLVHSYFTTLIFFLLGAGLDIVFNLRIFKDEFIAPAGLILFVFGTVLIIWAQHASHKFVKENLSVESFSRGPYRYTRNPTYWGLYLVLLGFGLVWNAVFVLISTAISFVVTWLIFLKQEEKVLTQKYGQAYLDYKNKVRL